MTVRFIAEVSSNHHADLERCQRFVETAAEIGCSAVKFQLFRIRELFAPEILDRSQKHRDRERWELPAAFVGPIADRCRHVGVELGGTPFYLDAVEELRPHVAFFKIGSYELLWDELLQACAASEKPVILSTGMATMDEVQRAVRVLREGGCQQLTLLHCVSSYPLASTDANLAALATLRDTCDCPVGWSDHSGDPAVIHRAVHRWGAQMVEFHLDLDRQGEEFAQGHCWLPEQIREVIDSVQRGVGADGDGVKRPAASEEADRLWRADPSDGLRPLIETRRTFGG